MFRIIARSVVFVVLMGLALSSQAQQSSKPDTATCSFTFVSGVNDTYLKYCVTANGNITQLDTPLGQELINRGFTVGEGYGICNETPPTAYSDLRMGRQWKLAARAA